MTIERGNFDEICASDIQELVDVRAQESITLEFKRDLYGQSGGEKRELLKDVSAFANSHGGHLILGVEEKDGAANRIVGTANCNLDGEVLRMEQIIRNGLDPAIVGVRMKAISLDSGRNVIVVRIPRSWNPPHRVVAQGSNRFFARHSSGVHEPTVEELRVLFTQTGSALEQAQQFREERLRMIKSNYGNRPLAGGGRLILHVVPVAAFSGLINLDVELAYRYHQAFRPLGAMGLSPRFNFHGFINERGGDKNHGYTQVFRNGILEATKAGIVSNVEKHGRFVHAPKFGKLIFDVLSSYIFGLRDVGVPAPLLIMLTLEGVKGARFAVPPSDWDDREPQLPDDVLFIPACTLESFGTELDHHVAIRPAFDTLWNASGYARSTAFNDEGMWKW